MGMQPWIRWRPRGSVYALDPSADRRGCVRWERGAYMQGRAAGRYCGSSLMLVACRATLGLYVFVLACGLLHFGAEYPGPTSNLCTV